MPHVTAIDRFAECAQDFCRWCEAAPPSEPCPDSRSREMRLLLARLIAAALELPRTDPGDAPEPEGVGNAVLKALHPRLASLPIDLYRVFFVPSELESQPGMATVADDLQDIYSDLKDGMWLLERGHADAAAWHWRLLFESHWGHHASDALHALQAHAAQA